MISFYVFLKLISMLFCIILLCKGLICFNKLMPKGEKIGD